MKPTPKQLDLAKEISQQYNEAKENIQNSIAKIKELSNLAESLPEDLGYDNLSEEDATNIEFIDIVRAIGKDDVRDSIEFMLDDVFDNEDEEEEDEED